MPLSSYRPRSEIHDDLVGPGGLVRPRWKDFGLALARSAADGTLTSWQQHAEQALRYSGSGTSDPSMFRYDPVPVVIDEDEWRFLQRGLTQRITLLEALVADLYGPMRCITAGVVPAAAVLGSPLFVRASVGLSPSRWLVRIATDVVRNAKGEFVVAADHTDVPIGMGYAMSYRAVSARLAAEGLRQLGVMSQTEWPEQLRQAITSVAPPERDSPRAVVLASASSPRFLDHSLLATNLGFHLAEDLDLSALGGTASLRSLTGLERVDAILRCTEYSGSDPLEITGTVGGVPGLTSLIRRGRVGVANPTGSGIASHLALSAFSHELCEFFLGEPLLIPTLESVWCGLADDRMSVQDNLSSYVIHDTGSPADTGGVSVFGGSLSDAESADWVSRMNRESYRFVAQPVIDLGTTPIVDAARVAPGIVSVRLFSVHGPSGVSVMPGGVGRVMRSSEPIATQQSNIGKDVWICSNTPAPNRGSLPVLATLPQTDFGGSIPARAAEAMLWIGRYAERCEAIARTASVVLARSEHDPWVLQVEDGRLASVLAHAMAAISGGGPQRGAGAESDEAVRLAVIEGLGERSGGLIDASDHLLSGVSSVRQFLSGLTWQALATLPTDARKARDGVLQPISALSTFSSDGLDRVTLALAAFAGLTSDSLVRGPAWRFLEIGRRLERSLFVLNLLETMLVEVPDAAEQAAFETVLSACESLVAYLRRYRSHTVFDAVTQTLITDLDNPRALAFQIEQLQRLLAGLPDRSGAVTQRRLLGDAGRQCGVPVNTPVELVDRVLAIRSLLLRVTASISEIWFRRTDVRARRVRPK
jgi:uncharacterized circularly permuted ATP-grasp superfamily protein/uncharacterized alpha-E superfamily protein